MDTESEAPDRVILQDEVKLYRARVVLAVLNGYVYDFKTSSVVLGATPMPVYAEDMRHIGFADVEAKGARIVADIAIDYASPERLLIETKSVRLFARARGTIKVAAIPLLDFQMPLPVLRVTLDGIQLTRLTPHDKRLPAVGEPVL